MDAPELQLTLIPAPDEPLPENLDELRQQFESLGLERQHPANRVKPATFAAWVLGPFTLGIGLTAGTAASIGAATFATFAKQFAESAGPLLATALGAWLHARYGRKVRIKVGEIEAEAQTPEELEKLLEKAQEIRERNEPKKIVP